MTPAEQRFTILASTSQGFAHVIHWNKKNREWKITFPQVKTSFSYTGRDKCLSFTAPTIDALFTLAAQHIEVHTKPKTILVQS